MVADEVNQLKKQVDAQQQLIRQMMEQQQQQSQQSQPRGALSAASTSTGASVSGKKFNFSEKDTELTSLMQRSPEPTSFANGNSASAGMTIQAIPSYGATTSTNAAQAPALLSSAGSTKSSTAASPRNAPPALPASAPAPVPMNVSKNTSNAVTNTGKTANVNGASNPVMPPRHVSLPCCVSFSLLVSFLTFLYTYFRCVLHLLVRLRRR